MTASQFEKKYLRPRTSRLHCIVVGTLAVDAATAHFVGLAAGFVSHTWSNSFSDTLDAVFQIFKGWVDAAGAML